MKVEVGRRLGDGKRNGVALEKLDDGFVGVLGANEIAGERKVVSEYERK